MGRPIKKKFFGNLNAPGTHGKTGAGGEGIGSISVTNSGTWYSFGTLVTVSSPQIADGTPATVNYSINTAGNITITSFTSGTGYTSTPTLTVTKASTATSTLNFGATATNTFTVTTATGISIGMLISGGGVGLNGHVQALTGNLVTSTVNNTGTFTNSTLSFTDTGTSFAATVGVTTRPNAISFTSYLTTGSSGVSGGDIMKQEGSKRYLVNNSQGIGTCKLAATDALTAGNMNIIATDGAGATYFVTKLLAYRARVVNRTSTSTALVVSGAKTGWTLGTATGTVVTITNA